MVFGGGDDDEDVEERADASGGFDSTQYAWCVASYIMHVFCVVAKCV